MSNADLIGAARVNDAGARDCRVPSRARQGSTDHGPRVKLTPRRPSSRPLPQYRLYIAREPEFSFTVDRRFLPNSTVLLVAADDEADER